MKLSKPSSPVARRGHLIPSVGDSGEAGAGLCGAFREDSYGGGGQAGRQVPNPCIGNSRVLLLIFPFNILQF